MTMDWKELLARLQEEGNLPEGEETVCGDEENAVEEGQHGPLRVITDRKGRKGKTATIIEGFTLDDGGVADRSEERRVGEEWRSRWRKRARRRNPHSGRLRGQSRGSAPVHGV